jgi:hypothetical protein
MQNIQFSISNCRAAASFVDYSILGIGNSRYIQFSIFKYGAVDYSKQAVLPRASYIQTAPLV